MKYVRDDPEEGCAGMSARHAVEPEVRNMEKVAYSMSAGNWGDGKSVCLWRTTKTESQKIARFQTDHAAKLFAEEMGFPLSPALEKRLSMSEG